MRVSCYCKRYLINPDFATFVKNGVPMCSAATCQKVQEHRDAMLHYPEDTDRLEGEMRRAEMRLIESRGQRFDVV